MFLSLLERLFFVHMLGMAKPSWPWRWSECKQMIRTLLSSCDTGPEIQHFGFRTPHPQLCTLLCSVLRSNWDLSVASGTEHGLTSTLEFSLALYGSPHILCCLSRINLNSLQWRASTSELHGEEGPTACIICVSWWWGGCNPCIKRKENALPRKLST